MARRDNYIDGTRLYSDILNADSSSGQKSSGYYKKVEKTMTKTVTNSGQSPSTKVVSTTYIKENDNPAQITKKVYTTGNYGSNGFENNQNFKSLGSNANTNGYEVYSRRFESLSKGEGSGFQPSYLNSGNAQSSSYKKSDVIKTTTRSVNTSSNSSNRAYNSNLGNSSLNNPKVTGYSSSKYTKIESYSKGGSGYSNNYGSSYLNNKENNLSSILDNEENTGSYLAKAKALLGQTTNTSDDISNRVTSSYNIKTTETENKVSSILDNEDNTGSYLTKAKAILGQTTNTSDDIANKGISSYNIKTTETEERTYSNNYNTDNNNIYISNENEQLDNENNEYNENNENNENIEKNENVEINENNNIYTYNKGKSLFNKVSSGARSLSTGNREKYAFTGSVKDRENYEYYNKEVVQIKNGRNSSEPKPLIRDDRNSIKIETKRIDEQGKLIENYEYKETKITKNKDKDSIVIHNRLGDPFYQNIIEERKRFSSYSPAPRKYGSYSLNQKDYGSSSYSNTGKTQIIERENIYKYKNNTQKTKSLIDTSKYSNTNTDSNINAIVNKYLNMSKDKNRSNTSNKYGSGNYNKSVTIEKRTEIRNVNNTGSRITSSTSQGRRKNVPSAYKTYEEKTDESYKKGTQYDVYGRQKPYDTGADSYKKITTTEEVYKTEVANKYQPKTKEITVKETTEDRYQQEGGSSGINQQTTKKENYAAELKQEAQETYQVDPIQQTYEPEGISSVQYGMDTYAIAQNYEPEGTSSVQYGMDTNAIAQNLEKEGTSSVQYGMDTNAIAQNLEPEGISSVQYGMDTNAIAQNLEKEGTSSVQYGMDTNAIAQNLEKEGATSLQYIKEPKNQGGQEGTDQDQYGKDGQNQEGQEGIDQNQYEQYNQYEEYGQYEYGQNQEGMDQGYYPMDPNAQNMYKKERRIQKKRIGYSQDPHICPVHGNKYGQNSQYVETRKEIRRFKGMEGDGGQFNRGGWRNMGGRREENIYEYTQEQINNSKGVNMGEIDNYQFYESRHFSKKIENKNSINVQKIVSSNESNENSLNLRNMGRSENIKIISSGTGSGEGIGQSTQNYQSVRVQDSQGGEFSKIYIATNVVPVYSEVINQQQRYLSLNGSHTCNICGANLISRGQMNSNSQGLVYSCPIHGQSITPQQQFSRY